MGNYNRRVVGKCGDCGGPVTTPIHWWGVERAVPACEHCGAAIDETAALPVLPMRRDPSQPVPAWRRDPSQN